MWDFIGYAKLAMRSHLRPVGAQTASQLAAGCVAIRARAYAEQFAHRYTHYRKATASHYGSVTMALDK